MRERESDRIRIAILNTRIQILLDTSCFKDRENTGFKFCAIHSALETTGQILRYFDLHVLVVNTGFIVSQ